MSQREDDIESLSQGDTTRLLLKGLSDAELGELFRRYLEDSEHDSWEGYDEDEVSVLYTMFRDMIRFLRHGGV